jgi:hypothetical protein
VRNGVGSSSVGRRVGSAVALPRCRCFFRLRVRWVKTRELRFRVSSPVTSSFRGAGCSRPDAVPGVLDDAWVWALSREPWSPSRPTSRRSTAAWRGGLAGLTSGSVTSSMGWILVKVFWSSGRVAMNRATEESPRWTTVEIRTARATGVRRAHGWRM